MARIVFAPAIQHHVPCPAREVAASTVGEALAAVLREQPELRGWLFTDQGRLRPHVAVFVDGDMIRDRGRLDEALGEHSEIYVAQALSGG